MKTPTLKLLNGTNAPRHRVLASPALRQWCDEFAAQLGEQSGGTRYDILRGNRSGHAVYADMYAVMPAELRADCRPARQAKPNTPRAAAQ